VASSIWLTGWGDYSADLAQRAGDSGCLGYEVQLGPVESHRMRAGPNIRRGGVLCKIGKRTTAIALLKCAESNAQSRKEGCLGSSAQFASTYRRAVVRLDPPCGPKGGRRDSKPQPPAQQAGALPIVLRPPRGTAPPSLPKQARIRLGAI